MKYVKVREVEITRNNISARQFWSYCKRQLAKKGVNLDDWADWDSFVNKDGKYSWYSYSKHLDWDEPKNERVEIKDYYQQTYLQDCYNFIIEYDTDFEWGYLYLVELSREDEPEEQKEVTTEEIVNDTVDGEESPIIVHEEIENGKVEYIKHYHGQIVKVNFWIETEEWEGKVFTYHIQEETITEGVYGNMGFTINPVYDCDTLQSAERWMLNKARDIAFTRFGEVVDYYLPEMNDDMEYRMKCN